MKNNLFLDHPIWDDVADPAETMTALLFRQCAARVTVIVQKLRDAGFEITNDCVEKVLLPSDIMKAELDLENPSDSDLELLELFNDFWEDNKERFEASSVPSLFNMSGGAEGLPSAVERFVTLADPSRFEDQGGDGTTPSTTEDGQEDDFTTSTPVSAFKQPSKPISKPRAVSVVNPAPPISRTVEINNGIDLRVQTLLAPEKKRKRDESSSGSDHSPPAPPAKKKSDPEDAPPAPPRSPHPRRRDRSGSGKRTKAKKETYAEKARADHESGEGNFVMQDGTRVHRADIRENF